ncbi:MAG: rhodanese-like domain-containing protein [Steroidobacteraceae bacterium]
MNRLLEYLSNHPFLGGGALLLAVVVAVFETRARKAEFAAVSPQDAIRLVNSGAQLLDVRNADRFAQGHIAGARSLPGDQVLKAGDTFKKKDRTFVVYCDTGSLGAAAVRQLNLQGFAKVFNLRGGLAGWRAESLPLERG